MAEHGQQETRPDELIPLDPLRSPSLGSEAASHGLRSLLAGSDELIPPDPLRSPGLGGEAVSHGLRGLLASQARCIGEKLFAPAAAYVPCDHLFNPSQHPRDALSAAAAIAEPDVDVWERKEPFRGDSARPSDTDQGSEAEVAGPPPHWPHCTVSPSLAWLAAPVFALRIFSAAVVCRLLGSHT